MKRIIAMCLAAFCIVQFSACQQPADGGDNRPSQGSTTTTDGAVGGDVATTTTEPLDVPGVTTETVVPSQSDISEPSSMTTGGNEPTKATTASGGNSSSVTTTTTKKTKTSSSKSNNANGNASVSTSQTSKPTTKATTVAGHKHQWKSKTIVPATCTIKGYTQYNCACGYSEKSEYTDAVGHLFGSWKTVKYPTDTEEGLEEQSCRRKGCTEKKTRSIPKLKVDADATQLRILELVNEQRAKEGLPALFYYSAEQAAADTRIKEIKSSEENFSHTRPNGEKFQTVLKGLGEDYFRCGENLAMGFDGSKAAEEVMSAWMNSPGHRKNIMNADFDAVVVGYSKDGYWVQLFIGYE